MRDQDEDDIDWEEFNNLSEAQVDAMEARLWRELDASLSAMSPKQLYEYRRRRRLDLCLRQRKIIREFPGIIFEKMLKSTQRRLVEQRIEYHTGVAAGHA